MALAGLIGEKLIKKGATEGEYVEVETSSSTKEGYVVGLYFSAHWCPPCRAFTPKLADWYNKVKSGENGEKFEIAFVSSDRDEKSFNEYFAEMPWHAVSYANRDVKVSCDITKGRYEDYVISRPHQNNLSRKFKVSGIPTLVLLEADTGKVITTDGRSIVVEDSEGVQFPWKPKPLAELIGDKFITNDKKEVGSEAIDGKILGLYFSAHWCGPCRSFTPQLVESYKKLKESEKNFEIIFCSSDRDEASFQEYFATMPWISLPLNDPRKKALSRHFDVSGIPTLVIVDENRKTITVQGRGAVNGDPDGKEFPWHPKPLNKLTGATAGQINDSPSLVFFTDGEPKNLESAVATLEPIAKEYVTKWKSEDREQEVYFFYAGTGDGSDDDIVQSLRHFASLPDRDPLLCIIDIPDQKTFTCDEAEVNEKTIRKFLEGYFNKTLDGKALRAS